MMRFFQSSLLGMLVLTTVGVVSASQLISKKRKQNVAAQERVFRSVQLVKAVQALSQCQDSLETLFVELGFETGLECDKNGTTLLHYACSLGTPGLVRYLIGLHEDGPETVQRLTNNEGETLLHFACCGIHVEIVRMLINEMEVQVDAVAHNGQTALFYATSEGHHLSAEVLLNSDAVVNKLDNDGATPIHGACYAGHLPVVTVLVERGASINVLSTVDTTPLHNAAGQGHLDVLEYLLMRENTQVDIVTSESITPLHNACFVEGKYCAQLLLNYGADVNAQTISGITPLMNATWKRNLSLVKFLIEQGADVNIQNVEQETAVHYAARNDHVVLLRRLVESGAMVDLTNKNGKEPIDLLPVPAYSKYYLTLQKNMKKRKVPPRDEQEIDLQVKTRAQKQRVDEEDEEIEVEIEQEPQQKKQATLLLIAEEARQNTLAKLEEFKQELKRLSSLIVNREENEVEEIPVAEVAIQRAAFPRVIAPPVVQPPAEYRVNVRGAIAFLLDAVKHGYLDAVKGYIGQSRALCDTRNDQLQTLLHVAVIANKIEVVRYLLECAVPLDAQDERGRTALHYACEANNLELTIQLFCKNCNRVLADNDGRRAGELSTNDIIVELVSKK